MGGDVVELGDDELVFEDDVELGEAGMGTEEIANMDTMLDDDVEDVGEIDLREETVGREVVPAAPLATRRTTVVVEPKSEGMGMRIVLVLTGLVLILGLPIVVSISKDHPGGLARMIAGLFGQDV
jgi:hypothetical protein